MELSSIVAKCLFIIAIQSILSEAVQTNWKRCHATENRPVRAIAIMKGQTVHGTVIFTQESCLLPVKVKVSLEGLSQGNHGFNIHEKGDLSGATCMTALGHYNPDSQIHGDREDKIRHDGDLGNIFANESGIVSTTFTDNVITLNGVRSIIGRAVIVHEDFDDMGRGKSLESLRSGNSGRRIACGVVAYA